MQLDPSLCLAVLRLTLTITISQLGSFALGERPNILWITSEDNGISWVSCYGGTNAETPAIDQLAREGLSLYQLLRQRRGLCSDSIGLDYGDVRDFQRDAADAESQSDSPRSNQILS